MEQLELRTTAQAVTATGSPRSLERGADGGRLVRIRHGAYVPAGAWNDADGVERMLARVEATRSSARHTEPVFVFESAAGLLGIPFLGAWPHRARTLVLIGGSKTNRSVERTQRDEPAGSIVVLADGVRVTSPLVTAIDLASTRTMLSGIVAFDHIRRHHGVSLEQILEELARRRPFPGVRRAELAARRSNPASDTPLETLVMVRADDYGFERAKQQRVFTGINGVDYPVDFDWRDGRILGEADGKAKYQLGADERGVTPLDRMWDEKRREDALRPTCDEFLRTNWDDAWRGAPLERSLLAARVPRIRRPRALTV